MTGTVAGDRKAMPVIRGGSESSSRRRFGIRRRNPSSAVDASIRARCLPRQRWTPCPKERCGTGRPGRNWSASSNTFSSQPGKRYVNETLGLELLCTKGGEGVLAVDGAPLAIKTSKPLPASD